MINTDYQLKLCAQLNSIITALGGEPIAVNQCDSLYDFAITANAMIAALAPGGGGGGTTNYNALTNKPSIGGVALQGDKTAEELALATIAQFNGLDTRITVLEGQSVKINDARITALVVSIQFLSKVAQIRVAKITQ